MEYIIEEVVQCWMPKNVTITLREPFEEEILAAFLREAIRGDLNPELDDLFRGILREIGKT